MLQILMLENHVDTDKRGGKAFYTGEIAQPLLVREIRHYEQTKVAQIHCTREGFKFLLRKVPSSGPFTLALPDCTIFLEAQARLLSVELSCFWISYHKLKRGTEGDLLRMKLQNFLKILEE